MKNFVFVMLPLFLAGNLIAQDPATGPDGTILPYTNIDVDEMEQLISDGDVIVLDVRTPAEVAEGAIPGAINIDVKQEGFEQRFEALNKEKTFLVYCRSGRRSVTACEVMADQGFGKLYNLLGGFNAWRDAEKSVYPSRD
jgi:rhodanese-related sulfurtransferase